MFGLIRLAVLCLMAFAAGVFFERSNQREACTLSGGVWSNGDNGSFCQQGEQHDG